jgi:hypothetical protein
LKTYIVALFVVVGVLAGFYGGFKAGQNNVSASTNTARQASRTPGSFNGLGGGGRTAGAVCPSPGAPSPSPGTQATARGTISNLSSTSLTISNTSCDVKVVFGNTVQVSKNVAGNTSDLKDNITVTIIGTRQADGSIKATTIQIGTAGPNTGGAATTAPSGG